MDVFLVNFYTSTNPGELEFSGNQSWVYYLCGAIFLILGLVSAFFSFKYRNSKKEYENIATTYSWFRRFWLLNRFLFFLLISIICVLSGIIFLLMNSVFLGG